ncbi:DUF2239 family protein [Marilutibacter chinensis]|uniref:DUF2239 family protein n=1 Tax=Marilutibacter chinensis TaxID=2912247 RepID=A0ABS9HSL7_9GAMM|nr:DUF2239 family protein [Lysobacter chinensis]MCF7221911.1 DUF2239 family protein [Lysobacter chinensis]
MDTTDTATTPPPRYTAFAGDGIVARGALAEVACAAGARLGDAAGPPVLVFADDDGRVIDLDLRGSAEDIRRRLTAAPAVPAPASGSRRGVLEKIGRGSAGARDGAEAARRPRGRPRMGVVAREVTLLPRHWDWLAEQPGGASAALRRLVEAARQTHAGRDGMRRSQEAAYRFMTTLAGDLPGYEEANRTLFAGDAEGFALHTADWPRDVREYAMKLAATALHGGQAGPAVAAR